MGLFNKNEQTVTLKVSGMSCAHCSKAVETALNALSDVKKSKVDLAAGTVTVTLKKPIDTIVLCKTIADVGYNAGDARNGRFL